MSVASVFPCLPDQFPDQTRYVIEGEDAGGGAVRIVARYPDGTRVDLIVDGPHVFACECVAAPARRLAVVA
jgi:hypothetical protein